MQFPKFQHTLFPGQQEHEKVYLVIRQHWAIFAIKSVIWLIFVFIFLLVNNLVARYAPILLASPYVEMFNLAKSVYLLFLALGLLILWIMYYLNVQIVTDHRVVDITQNSLFSHTISELNLGRTEDVTAEVKGFFQTFLNFGNVYIQTAGTLERFEFINIPNPPAVEKLILDLYEELPAEAKFKK